MDVAHCDRAPGATRPKERGKVMVSDFLYDILPARYTCVDIDLVFLAVNRVFPLQSDVLQAEAMGKAFCRYHMEEGGVESRAAPTTSSVVAPPAHC